MYAIRSYYVREQPGNTVVLDMLTFDLVAGGYLQEAAEYAKRLVALDPLSDLSRGRYGNSLMALGRDEEAIGFAFPFLRGALYFFSGQYDRAVEVYEGVVDGFAPGFDTGGPVDTSWVVEAVHRITSYNVCYTKLLRDPDASGDPNLFWFVAVR